MGAERKLFIDIDRQPGSERPRPAGVPAGQSSIGALWPSSTDTAASAGPPDTAAPPAPSGRVQNLAILPTMPLDSNLVEGLAALAPRSSTSRPLSLAEALAPMQAQTPPPPRPPTRLLDPDPPPPAGPTPAPVEQPASESPPEVTPPAPAQPDTERRLRVRAADAEPQTPPQAASLQEPTDDEYLTRSYDLTRPAAAELYEQAVVPLWSAPFGRMLLSVFQTYPRQPGWQVIDVGCGTGYPTLDVAQLLGPDADVAGIDVWSVGIEYARAGASDLRLNNVAFLVADVAACSLPDQSFDVALCNLGLTHFTRPDAALKGIARLLQPEGTLILTTNLRGSMQEFFETYRAVLNDLGLLDLSWDVERLMHLQPTLERVEALLDMAGFTVDQTLTDHFVLEFPNGSAFLRSPMVGLNFLPGWRHVIGDLSLRRVVFHEIERRLNARAAALDHLDLLVRMLCVTARRRAVGD
jgi:arsenite methyltransferase